MLPESLGFSGTTIEFWGWFVFIIWCYFSVFIFLETILQGRMGNPEKNKIECNQGPVRLSSESKTDTRTDKMIL